jgi:hypothetical protein
MSDDVDGASANEQETKPKAVPTSLQELNEALFNKVTMFRPAANDKSYQWFSPDAHVIGMVTSAMNSTAAAFRQDYWPELVALMRKATDNEFDFDEEVLKAHDVMFAYLKRITDKNIPDLTYLQTLVECGWNDIKPSAQITYMSMFSRYFMARMWVACRQQLAMGTQPAKKFDEIAENAGELIRLMTENANPEQEAKHVLEDAVRRAISAGIPARVVSTIVDKAVADKL